MAWKPDKPLRTSQLLIMTCSLGDKLEAVVSNGYRAAPWNREPRPRSTPTQPVRTKAKRMYERKYSMYPISLVYRAWSDAALGLPSLVSESLEEPNCL